MNPYQKRPYVKDAAPQIGGQSPWGTIDHMAKLADGVIFVFTPSHGGVWLSDDRVKEIPESIISTNFLGFRKWWEEDCDAIKVLRVLGLADVQI